jgi:hypothetical protein
VKKLVLFIVGLVIVVSLSGCYKVDDYSVVISNDELQAFGFTSDSGIHFLMSNNGDEINEVSTEVSNLSLDVSIYDDILEDSTVNIQFFIINQVICPGGIALQYENNEVLPFTTLLLYGECNNDINIVANSFSIDYQIQYTDISENPVLLEGTLKTIDDINQYQYSKFYDDENSNVYGGENYSFYLRINTKEQDNVENIISIKLYTSLEMIGALDMPENDTIDISLLLNDEEICHQTKKIIYISNSPYVVGYDMTCFMGYTFNDQISNDYQDGMSFSMELTYLNHQGVLETETIEIADYESISEIEFQYR